jgi:hypothetical protein
MHDAEYAKQKNKQTKTRYKLGEETKEGREEANATKEQTRCEVCIYMNE